jgi:hypothetical protein
MLDLKAIRKRHLNPERTVMRTYYEGHIEVDLALLVEECEHLHSERQMLLNYIEGKSLEWRKGDLVDVLMQNEDKRRAALLAQVAAWLEDHDYTDAAKRIVAEMGR